MLKWLLTLVGAEVHRTACRQCLGGLSLMVLPGHSFVCHLMAFICMSMAFIFMSLNGIYFNVT